MRPSSATPPPTPRRPTAATPRRWPPSRRSCPRPRPTRTRTRSRRSTRPGGATCSPETTPATWPGSPTARASCWASRRADRRPASSAVPAEQLHRVVVEHLVVPRLGDAAADVGELVGVPVRIVGREAEDVLGGDELQQLAEVVAAR